MKRSGKKLLKSSLGDFRRSVNRDDDDDEDLDFPLDDESENDDEMDEGVLGDPSNRMCRLMLKALVPTNSIYTSKDINSRLIQALPPTYKRAVDTLQWTARYKAVKKAEIEAVRNKIIEEYDAIEARSIATAHEMALQRSVKQLQEMYQSIKTQRNLAKEELIQLKSQAREFINNSNEWGDGFSRGSTTEPLSVPHDILLFHQATADIQ